VEVTKISSFLLNNIVPFHIHVNVSKIKFVINTNNDELLKTISKHGRNTKEERKI
jgi:hypothetical protein